MIYTIKNDPMYTGISLNELSNMYISFHQYDFDYFNEAFKDIPSNVASKISSTLKTKTKSLLKEICGKCKSDFRFIEKDVDKVLNDVGEDIKKNGLTSSVSSGMKSLSRIITNLLLKSDELMQDIADKLDLNMYGIQGKIANSLYLLFVVLLTSFCVETILVFLFRGAGSIITMTIVGPLIEEGAKQVAARNGYAEVYNVIFNIFEFGGYVRLYVSQGAKLGKAVFVRLLSVGMHSVNQFIAWASDNPEIGKKLGFKFDTEEDRQKNRSIAMGIQWAIHMAWNVVAVAFGDKIDNFAYR